MYVPEASPDPRGGRIYKSEMNRDTDGPDTSVNRRHDHAVAGDDGFRYIGPINHRSPGRVLPLRGQLETSGEVSPRKNPPRP